MAFIDCINRKLEEGLIDGKKTDEILKIYNEKLQKKLELGMSEAEASEKAAEETMEAANWQAIAKKRRNLLHAKTASERIPGILNYEDGTGTSNPGHALTTLLDYDPHGNQKQPNISKMKESFFNRYTSRFTQKVNDLGTFSNWNGKRKAVMQNVIRSFYGQETDEIAEGIAKSFKEVSDLAFNEARLYGSTIPELEDWNAPNFKFDFKAVRDAGPEEFKKDMRRVLDVEQVEKNIEKQTGQTEDLEMVLDKIYSNITSDGLAKGKGIPERTGLFSDKQSKHRIFQYADAENWIEAHDKYGKNPIFDTMVNYLQGLARDNAIMYVMGPKPEAMWNTIVDVAEKKAGKMSENEEMVQRYFGMFDQEPKDAFRKSKKEAEELKETIFRGSEDVDHALWEPTGFINLLRNGMSSAMLGSAPVIATTDLAYSQMASKFNGTPQMKVLMRQLKDQMPYLGREDEQLAKRSALISDAANMVGQQDSRWLGMLDGEGQWMANFTLSASLLNRWTRRMRVAHNLEMTANIARMSKRTWDELDQDALGSQLKKRLPEHRIGKREWNKAIYNSDAVVEQGIDFVRPTKDLRTNELSNKEVDDIGKRLHEFILTEQDYAVPTTSARAQNRLSTNTNGVIGAVGKAGTQFMSFPVTMHLTHITRGFMQTDSLTGVGKYLGGTIVGSTMIAAAALQFEAIKEGRDPIDISQQPKKFFQKALLRGGGFGPLGDVIYGAASSARGDLIEGMAGPAFDWPTDTRNVIREGAMAATGKEDAKFGKKLTDYLGRYTPGNNIWYSELAFDRMIMDNIQKFVDPNASRNFEKTEDFYQRKNNQEFWWKPGETEPERAPDFSKAVGE